MLKFDDNTDIMELVVPALEKEFSDGETHFISLIKNNMSTLKTILSSRTTWTIIVLFLYNGVSAIHSVFPASATPLLDGILSIVAIYFHITPSQSYGNSVLPTTPTV